MSVCITRSNPDYRTLAQGSNYTEETLDFIVNAYWKEHPEKAAEGNESYPSLDYVKNFYDTQTSVAEIPATIRLWRRDVRDTFDYNTKDEAAVKRNELAETFGEDAVYIWGTKDGKYHVKVARPLLEDKERTFSLNREQKNAVAKISDWFMDRQEDRTTDNWIVLEGEAGTGKTSVISDILLNTVNMYGDRVVAGAVSNQATDNIIEKLSEQVKKIFTIDRKTVAGMLGLKQNLNTATKDFVPDGSGNKILYSNIAIIDEASMITEQLIEAVEQAAKRGIPVLFIGDAAQINPIREGSYFTSHPEIKKDQPSPVFTSKSDHIVIALKERVRQGEGSPILELASSYRQAWENNTPVPSVMGKQSSADGRLIYTSKPTSKLIRDLIPIFQEAIRTNNPNLIHIVPYHRDYKDAWEPLKDEQGNVLYKTDRYDNQVPIQRKTLGAMHPHGNAWWNQRIYDLIHPDTAGTYVFHPNDLVRFDDSFTLGLNDIINNSENAQVVSVSDTFTDSYGVRYNNVTVKLSTGRIVEVPAIQQDYDNLKKYQDVVGTMFGRASLKYGEERKIAYTNAWRYVNGYAKLMFSFALNVHRAQGSTYDITVLDQDDIDSVKPVYRNNPRELASLGYTAATRAKNVLVVASQQASDPNMTIDLLATNKRFNEARNKGPVTIAKPSATKETKELNTPQEAKPINVVSTNPETRILSNFAQIPFKPNSSTKNYNTGVTENTWKYPGGTDILSGSMTFNTLEGAFQACKLAFTSAYSKEEKRDIIKKLSKATGRQARDIGKSLEGLDTKAWDAVSSDVMYQLLYEKFLQNDDAAEALLNTGDEKLTHSIPDFGKSNFIGNLTKVREEMKAAAVKKLIPSTNSELSDAVDSAMQTTSRIRVKKALKDNGGNPIVSLPADGVYSADSVLLSVANGMIDPNMSESARKLAASLIPLAQRLGLKVQFTSKKEKAAGRTYKTNEKGYDITIYSSENKIKAQPGQTILHEVTHALTTALLSSDIDFRNGIAQLKKYVLNYIRDNSFNGEVKTKEYLLYDEESQQYRRHSLNFDVYALSTPGEFLAEAIGNENFQRVLKNIPAPEDSKLTVWDRIVRLVTDAFSKVFKKYYRAKKSVYDELMPVISLAMEGGSYAIDRSKGTATEKEVTDEMTKEAASVLQTRSPEAFAGVAESQATISDGRTILSNEELKYWNENGVGEFPRILTASEHSDPAFHTKRILDVLNGVTSVQDRFGNTFTGKDFAGLYIVTKHDGLPILDLLQTKIPKLIHFSITTLGGTKYEPGVMRYNDLLDRIEDYIKQGLDPNSVTIRIDPIVPGVTNYTDIEEVVRRASMMGIKRIRFSVMDGYANTVQALEGLGYDFEKYYGANTDSPSHKYNFFAKEEYMNDIYDFMLSLKDKYDITLGTCAEYKGRTGINKEGCLSVSAVNNMLGTHIVDRGTANNQQRKLCACYGGKVDALAYGDNCASHCVYCYAKHHNDRALQYYDKDGNLKVNVFTQTRREAQAEKKVNPLEAYTMHSGGAEGADTLWDEMAKKYGIKSDNINHYYHGKKPNALANRPLTNAEFEEGKQMVMRANQTLHRRPEKYMDLLARNWMQVKNSDAMFAIGTLEGNIVSGGTGWAVQMAIDSGKPVYVLDLLGTFMQWDYDKKAFVPMSEAPVLTKNFAGIGTREISTNDTVAKTARDMVTAVFEKTLLSTSPEIGTKDAEKPTPNIPQSKAVYIISDAELSQRDARKFNSAHYFTPLVEEKNNIIVRTLKEDVESGVLGIGARLVINGDGSTEEIIKAVKVLKGAKAAKIYEGSALPVEIGKFFKDDLAELSKIGVLSDDKYVYLPTFSVGLSERQLSDIDKRERVVNSKLFTPSQIRAIGLKAMWKVSDIVTKLQTGGVNASREFLAGIEGLSEKDFTGYDRVQIISEVGITRLLDIARDILFAPEGTDTPKELAKKQFIKENYNIIYEQAQDALALNEEVTLTKNSVEKTATTQEVGGELSEILNTDSAMEVAELLGPATEHWMVGFRQVSAISSLATMVRRNLSTLLDLDAEGNALQDEYGPKLVDVHQAVVDMLHWVSGAKNSDEMIKKLQEHLSTTPWLNQLVGSYYEDGDPSKPTKQGILLRPENSQLKTRFFTNFSKYFQPYIVMYKTDSGETRINEINTKQFTDSAMADLRTADEHKDLDYLRIWNPKGELSDDFYELTRIVGQRADVKGGFPATGMQAPREAVSRKDLEDIQKALYLLNTKSPSIDELGIVVDSVQKFNDIATRLYYIINGSSKGAGIRSRAESYRKNNQNGFTLFGPDTLIKNNITGILRILEPVLHSNLEAVSYEAGKMHYGYIQPSYLNMHISDLKGNVDNYPEYLAHNFKRYDGWFFTAGGNKALAGEGWLNEWLEMLEQRQDYRNALQHVASLAFDGTGYTDKISPQMGASLLFAYFYDVNKAFAYYRVLLLSNKPSEEYIKFVRFSTGYESHIIDNIIRRTLPAEINRIRTVRERLAKVANKELNEDCLVENLETNDKNGTKFYFLKFLNDHIEQGTVLGDMVSDMIDGTLAFDPTNDRYVSFKSLFRDEFPKFMNNRFEKFLDNLEEDGTITRERGEITSVYGVQDKVGIRTAARNNLREFFWNDWYAQLNMQQILFGDPAQYVNAEDLQKRAAQFHSPGMRPDLAALDTKTMLPVSDGYERFMVISDIIKPSSAVTVLEQVHGKILSDPKFTNPDGTLTDLGKEKNRMLERIRNLFKEDNETDGQAIISPTGLRKIMHLFGKWDTHMEEVYDKIMSGDFTNEDLDVIWPVIKPFSYSVIAKNTYSQRLPFYSMGVQQKNSMFPVVLAGALARNVGIDNWLTALYDVMEGASREGDHAKNNGIDAILFDSNLKTGVSGRTDISKMTPDEVRSTLNERMKPAEGQKDIDGRQRLYNNDYVYEIPFNDWSQQQEVPNHFEGTQQKGSQQRVLTVADTPNTYRDADGKYVDNKITVRLLDGTETEMTVREAKAMYFDANAANIQRSADRLAKELALDTKNRKLRNIALSNALVEELHRDGRYGSDMIRAISVDRYGEFITPLSDPMLAGVIQQMLNSLIKNRIYKQQIAGGPLVQVSSFGLRDDLKIVYGKKTGRPLYAEVMISAPNEWYEKDENGEYIYKEFFDENEELSIENIRKANPKILEMVGYRIPTEAKYSMLPMRIVGFLPRSTESIMLPKEITVLSGSDFDVDKLYIMRHVFKRLVNKKTGRVAYVTDVKDPEARNNNISLDISWAFLTSELNTDQVISAGQFDDLKTVGYTIAATDNRTEGSATDFVNKNQGKDYKALKKEAYSASDLMFADTQIKFFKQNMVAAKLIGVFAQSNVSHSFVSLLYDKGFVPTIKLSESLKLRLLDRNGSVHTLVDDVYIDSEWDWTGLKRISAVLAECIGASVDAVKDPIFNLMNINMTTVNVFTAMIRMGWDADSMAWFLTTPIIKELVKRYDRLNADGSATIESVISQLQVEVANQRSMVFDENHAWSKEDFVGMHDLEVAPQKMQGESDDEFTRRQYETAHRNWQLLELFRRMQGIAELMRSIVHVTRINSISSAPGPFAANTFVNDLKTDKFITKKALAGVRDVLNNPVIGTFLGTTTSLVQNILGENLVQAGPLARTIYENMEAMYGYINDELAQKMSEFMASYLTNWISPVFDLSYENRRKMILAFPNIFNRTKFRYPDNLLLKSINLKFDDAHHPFLDLNTRGLQDDDISDLKAAWSTLYKEEAKRLQGRDPYDINDGNLALLLVAYNFFRGGFGFDSKTFTRIVPEDVKDALGNYRANTRKLTQISGDSVDVKNLIYQFMLNTGRTNMPMQEDLVLRKREDGTLYITKDEGERRAFASDGIVAVKQKNKTVKYYLVQYDAKAEEFLMFPVSKLGGKNFAFEIEPRTDVRNIKSLFEETTAKPEASGQTPNDSKPSSLDFLAEGAGPSSTTKALMNKLLGNEWAKKYNKGGKTDVISAFRDMTDMFFDIWKSQAVDKITENDTFVLNVLKDVNFNLPEGEKEKLIARAAERLDKENICH